MALNQSKPLPPSVLAEDEESFDALTKMADYTPSNAGFAMEVITAKHATVATALSEEREAARMLNDKRDALVAAQWELHNLVLGARQQVLAQYGENSNQVAAVGLKKKQEYKRPTRKAIAAKPAA